ncbi:MAG TPA: hypothetical protein VEI97_09985, partial [bacterium]|nr:hypothetical protein [bacterium]
SGDREFNAFADRYAEGLTPKVHGLARLIAEGAPLSVNPNHFGLPAVAHDVAQRTNDLDLRRKASELMHFLVEHLYDRQHRTVYPNYGTDKGPGSDTRQAIDQFTAIDGLWRYARATGDTEAERLARDLSLGYSPNTQNPAPFMDPNQDLYRLYATQNALGTYPQVDQASVISARLNFMVLPVIQALNAASGFTEHEEDYALALEFFERKFYDEIYNGFYDSYTLNPSGVEYDPVPKGEEYFLQVDIPIYFNYLRLNDLYERKLHRQGGSAAPATPAAPAADEAEAAAEAAGSDTTAAAETDAEAAAETAAGEATDNE